MIFPNSDEPKEFYRKDRENLKNFLGGPSALGSSNILDTSRKRVLGGLYRQICVLCEERKSRGVFVIY